MNSQFQIFWRKADRLWKMHNKDRELSTLLSRLDYLGKLKKQLPLAEIGGPCRVLYNKSGADLLRAARTTGAPFEKSIVTESAYYHMANSEDEALYLVGILNCPALQGAFVSSKTSLRHFDLNPLKSIPIPQYNAKSALHRKIAKAAGACEAAAAVLDLAGNRNDTKAILEELNRKGLLGKLDVLVKKLLPEHAK